VTGKRIRLWLGAAHRRRPFAIADALAMPDGVIRGMFILGQNPADGGHNARLVRRRLGFGHVAHDEPVEFGQSALRRRSQYFDPRGKGVHLRSAPRPAGGDAMTVHPRALDYTQSFLSGVIPDEAELTAGQRVEPSRSYGFFTDTTLCLRGRLQGMERAAGR
jgi:hypothetical protein